MEQFPINPLILSYFLMAVLVFAGVVFIWAGIDEFRQERNHKRRMAAQWAEHLKRMEAIKNRQYAARGGRCQFVRNGEHVQCWIGDPGHPESELVFEVHQYWAADIAAGLSEMA